MNNNGSQLLKRRKHFAHAKYIIEKYCIYLLFLY
nr:MAG TPA: hypothetical protein [Caudoviricetes sp.]